jgi:putative sigma-54 modulation protein
VRTIVRGKNYEVPERVREYAERKLTRLERYLDDRSEATVELSIEQHRSAADSHIVDVSLVIDGTPLRGRAAAPSHKVGIDEVLDKIERRAVDFRETSRVRKSPETVRRGEQTAVDSAAGAPEEDEAPGQVVKIKRFAIEPMFEEDAVARMEELGHAFFVFVNAENERVAILYRRRAGDFGLIEPVIAGGYTKGGPLGRSPAVRSSEAGSGTTRR